MKTGDQIHLSRRLMRTILLMPAVAVAVATSATPAAASVVAGHAAAVSSLRPATTTKQHAGVRAHHSVASKQFGGKVGGPELHFGRKVGRPTKYCFRRVGHPHKEFFRRVGSAA